MKYAEVAENVKRLVETPPSRDEFIYELLLAYNTPKNTVARLKKGLLNQSKEPGEVLLKKKVWFKPLNISNHEIHQRHERMRATKKMYRRRLACLQKSRATGSKRDARSTL